jgi:phosphoheptose isomerase
MNALNNLKLIKANFKLLQHLKYIKKIHEIFCLLKKCIQKDNKIIFCGNGSSAADSEHL